MDAALASHVAHLTHRAAAAPGDAGDDSSPLHLASFVDVVDPAAVLGMGRKKFAELDANGNQELDGEELDMLVAVMCAQYARPGVSSQLVVKDALRAMEACGGGATSMTFEDFKAFFERLARRHHAYRRLMVHQHAHLKEGVDLEAKFRELDSGGTGVIQGPIRVGGGGWG